MTEKELKKIEQSIIGGLNTCMDFIKMYHCDEVTPNDVFELHNNSYRIIPSIYKSIKTPIGGKKQSKKRKILNRQIISATFPIMAN